MATHLDNFQMKQLQSTLESVLCNYEIRTVATESLEREKQIINKRTGIF